ncbi:titin-like [Mercenaria mercenaria]|uniref:titin-like n=1 Tax=Mercenaria mercenaria TaxID=6596 RepID=UPI00234F518D|nr:titin-like [Mercenaria mercenaria]
MGNKKSSIKTGEEIKDSSEPLKFKTDISDIEVGSKTSTATFLCELNMSQIEVEWYYCSKRLHPSHKYAIIDDGFIHKLKISNVSENDEGKYSVIAKGIRSEAKLYVEAHCKSKDL